jgi:hypothetical protein
VTALASGDTEYVDEPFEYPDPGFILICCSRPTNDIELKL